MQFNWDDTKNASLKKERGVSFERIVIAIEEGHLLDVLDHPDKTKYGNQLILVIEIDGYAFCVPCVQEQSGDLFLKTIFPSRKYTKLYISGGRNE